MSEHAKITSYCVVLLGPFLPLRQCAMVASTLHQNGRLVLASAGGSSSAVRRVKPFTSYPRTARQPTVATRAAAVETEEFSFSFSDAKKSNEYSPADVQSALDYFSGEAATAPSYNEDFVTNELGVEDASFFDDVDNNEAYQADEYTAAGIPEAAPKKKGGRRRDQGGADEGDEVEQAEALQKVRDLEDRMVMEAAMEEEYGKDRTDIEAPMDSKSGVWDWLLDPSADDDDGQDLTDVRQVSSKQSTAILVSDAQLANDLASITPESFPEAGDITVYTELFSVGDDVTDETLKIVTDVEDDLDDMPTDSTITDEELARLDAILDIEIPPLEIEEMEELPEVPVLEDEPELNPDSVNDYIAQLRSTLDAEEDMPEDEVQALFGDTPLVEERPDEVVLSQEELDEVLNAPEPPLEALQQQLDQVTLADPAEGEDEDEDEDEDKEDDEVAQEMRELNAFGPMLELPWPTETQLDEADAIIASAEDFIAAEEGRNQELAAAVERGELSPDALAQELEDAPDTMAELLQEATEQAEEEEGLPDQAVDDDSDGQKWTERIIELRRVTKVVKGGKIMGFRCVAVIGNQNGLVGVGCMSGREVATAVKRTLVDARRNVVQVPLVGAGTIPHRAEAKFHAARCVIVPASDGTGCIAGGSIRSVLELAGVRNVLGKRIGSRSALNSARATVKALQSLQTLGEVSQARGVPVQRLLLPAMN
ncbi:hypothetical protein QJQ45_028527 [Haematococcus lacustris]|nr:hypothetical protein QJQ45_028527 [Haematococcus lacustris]